MPLPTGFLSDLQLIHDNSVSQEGGSNFNRYMQKKLRELAEIHNLVIPETPIPMEPQVEGYKPQWKR